MSLDSRNIGGLLKKILEAEYDREENVALDDPRNSLILSSPEKDVEVYFSPETFKHKEPEFYMVTNDDVLVKISATGVPKSMHKLTDKENKKSLDLVFELHPRETFHIYRQQLPVNGVLDNPDLMSEQLFEELINYVSRKEKKATAVKIKDYAKHFQTLTYNSLVARFNLLTSSLGSADIIPDQSTLTLFAKAGNGCDKACLYCPEPFNTKFTVSSEEEYREELEKMRSGLEEILGKGIENLHEGFVNISDISLLDRYLKKDKTNLNSKKAISMMREYFPQLQKIGSFIGASVLEQVEDDSFKSKYDRLVEYFKALSDIGCNRLYLGLETAHDEGSFLLNKRFSYDEKKLVSDAIQETNIKLKVIVQIGVLGEKFYSSKQGQLLSWREHVDETIKWINKVEPYRVMFSIWQNYGNLPINKKVINQGKIVPYKTVEQYQNEIKELQKGINVPPQLKVFNHIETDYHQVLPPSGKPPDHKPTLVKIH